MANGNKCNLEYLGFEIQQESTWTYFEVKNIKELKQLAKTLSVFPLIPLLIQIKFKLNIIKTYLNIFLARNAS